MRLLLTIKSRKELFDFLKQKYNCKSFQELSIKINVPFNTLQKWMYNKERYIPKNRIPIEILSKLKFLDIKKNNWGQIKGGRETYKLLLNKYGKKELLKRKLKGAIKSKQVRLDRETPFILDLKNPSFLEFYGILLGDGWLSKLQYKEKNIWLIGISGHYKLDRDFFIYCKNNIRNLFSRNAYLKERPKYNSIELHFTHKTFLNALHKILRFPIGKKIDLKISDKIYTKGFDSMKYVIRGIFDTDGSFYLDKTPVGKPYPCISIHMHSPKLIKQIFDTLIKQGFSVSYNKNSSKLTLKGKRQLIKWMNEIGSSNNKHLHKINEFIGSSNSVG
jgi:hypothetical protein